MSTVWVAADMRLHTQVAVKILSPTLLSDTTQRARFVREGRLPAEIQSPHLVQIYEEGELEDSTPFFIMEWLEGETLKQRLRRVTRLSIADSVSVTAQLARALGRAHKLGVVHRDVKADNVFVLRGDDVLVKLLDFGVAKRIDGDGLSIVTRRDETLGTPSYMSPEQLRHASQVDFRADLWALAVLAYRMLFGTLPFARPDYPALCLAICEAEYLTPSSLDPRWPPSVDAWFARSFSLDREARFASADEAVATLAHALAELGDVHPAGADTGSHSWDDAETLPRMSSSSLPPMSTPMSSSPSGPYSAPWDSGRYDAGYESGPYDSQRLDGSRVDGSRLDGSRSSNRGGNGTS
jgi:eukaryotic-like serine/threonine-protein kinase